MAARWYKSTLPNDFEQQVENHIQALRQHRATTKRPVPTALPQVEQSVKRIQYPVEDEKPDDFVADYEIIDDVSN